MAVIRGDQKLTWELLNRDKFLRNKEAPALFEDPVTSRDIRGGAEMIARSGNIMPRAITRDKLGQDALLQPLNLGVTAGDVVHVATGYDRSLNDYIFAVTFDGTNYYLRRYNTLDLLSPYQDAFSVNLPVDDTRFDILGVTVSDDRVIVLARTNNGVKALKYTFDLTYDTAVTAKPFAFETKEFERNFVYDGKYFVHSLPSSGRLLLGVGTGETSSDILSIGGDNKQRFTTTADGGNIKRIGVALKNTSPTEAAQWDNVALYSSGGSSLFSATPNANIPANSATAWYYYGVDWSVSTSTQYLIGFSAGSLGSPQIARGPDRYSGGYYIGTGSDPGSGTLDALFLIYQALPATWQGKIVRFNSDYTVADTFTWPGGTTQPDELLAYDQKFYYGLISSENKIVKFAIQDGQIVVAAEQTIYETVKGILHFNSFVFFIYQLGTTIVAVPVSI